MPEAAGEILDLNLIKIFDKPNRLCKFLKISDFDDGLDCIGVARKRRGTAILVPHAHTSPVILAHPLGLLLFLEKSPKGEKINSCFLGSPLDFHMAYGFLRGIKSN